MIITNVLTLSFSCLFMIFTEVSIIIAQTNFSYFHIDKTHPNKIIENTNYQDSVLTEIGRWGEGPCYSVRAVGNYLAIGNGSVLQILDFSDPSKPIVIGQVLTESIIEDMEVKGNYFFKISPFEVIDVSDAMNPKVVFIDTIGLDAEEITIVGDYVYIGDFVGNIFIIDISNPLEPKRLGSMFASGEDVWSITVKEPYLYASTFASYLVDIFDISNKSNPKDASKYWTTSSVAALKVYENYLVEAGAPNNGFKIFDLSDPLNVSLIGDTDIGHHVKEITISDTLVYLTGTKEITGVLTIINMTDVKNPKVISSIQITEPPFGSGQHFLYGDLLYIAVGRGLTIIDVNDVTKPKQAGYYATAFQTSKIAIKSNYAFIASDYVGMKIIDFSNTSKPKTVGEYITNTRVFDIALNDNTAYLCTDSALISIDVTEEDTPKELYRISLRVSTNLTLAVYNSYAFITSSLDTSITIFDISESVKIKELGSFKTASWSARLGVTQKEDSLIIYSAEVNSGLQIYSIPTPIHTNFDVIEIDFNNNIRVNGLYLRDNKLYLATTGIEIYDIADPAKPINLGKIDTPGGRITVDVVSDNKYTYLAYSGYLICIDVSDSYYPQITAILNDYVTRNVSIIDNLIFLGTYLNGMKILKNNIVTGIQDEIERNMINAFNLYQKYPNPFNPATKIRYTIPQFSLVTIKVFDLLGREVITLVNKEQSAGNYEVEFNAGSLPSGIYIYSIRTGGYTACKKMSLIK